MIFSWVKMAAAAVVLGGLLTLGLIVRGWKNDAERVPGLELQIVQVNQTLNEERRLLKEADAASKGFQDELENLRTTRASAPVRIVRVCNVPAVSASPADPAAEPGSDEGAAASGDVPEEVGPEAGRDIGQFLYDQADRADELAAQVRGLQDYIVRMQKEQTPGG